MEIAVIRAMPNTPSALGAGAAALCRGRYVSAKQMELAERIFATVGRTVVVDEKHMDAVTGLSGSGPAYIYIIIEALAQVAGLLAFLSADELPDDTTRFYFVGIDKARFRMLVRSRPSWEDAMVSWYQRPASVDANAM